jgi:hypothetical protein
MGKHFYSFCARKKLFCMRILVDEQGNTVAYLYKKAIVDKSFSKVLGVVLGNCLFAKADEPVGRIFNDTFRDEQGNIIARLTNQHQVEHQLNAADIRNGAWEIMMQIKEHVCNWLPDKKVWSSENIESFLHRKSSPAVLAG